MLAALAIAMLGTHLRAAPDPNPTISVNTDGVLEVTAPMNVMGKLWIEGLVGDGDVASRIETAFESLESTTVSLRTKASVEECEAAKTLATNALSKAEANNVGMKQRVQELEDQVAVLTENQGLINDALDKLHLKVAFHATTKTSTTKTSTVTTTTKTTTITTITTTKTTTTTYVPKCLVNNKFEDGKKGWTQKSGNAFNSFPRDMNFGNNKPPNTRKGVRTEPENAVGILQSDLFKVTKQYICYYGTGFCQSHDSQCAWTRINSASFDAVDWVAAASGGDAYNGNVGDNWVRHCHDISKWKGGMASISLHDTMSGSSYAWGGWDDFSCCDNINDCI